MITYELALKLKEAGFPQREEMMLTADDFPSGFYGKDSLQRRDIGKHCWFDFSRYPENTDDPVSEWDGKLRPTTMCGIEYLGTIEGKERTVYIPTLEELIEACGNEFANLGRTENGWVALADRPGLEIPVTAQKPTPSEAVANLWLALNKKS